MRGCVLGLTGSKCRGVVCDQISRLVAAAHDDGVPHHRHGGKAARILSVRRDRIERLGRFNGEFNSCQFLLLNAVKQPVHRIAAAENEVG